MKMLHEKERVALPAGYMVTPARSPSVMKREYGKSVGTVASLLVFGVFAMSVFAVLALGVGAYKSIAEKPRQGYDERICLSYIWTKVKNGDDAGSVYVGDFHGLPALYLDEAHESTVYQTVIYYYNDYVHELFFESGYEYRPDEGVPLFPAEPLLLEQTENGLIKVSAGRESVFISPRGGTDIRLPEGGAAG